MMVVSWFSQPKRRKDSRPWALWCASPGSKKRNKLAHLCWGLMHQAQNKLAEGKRGNRLLFHVGSKQINPLYISHNAANKTEHDIYRISNIYRGVLVSYVRSFGGNRIRELLGSRGFIAAKDELLLRCLQWRHLIVRCFWFMFLWVSNSKRQRIFILCFEFVYNIQSQANTVRFFSLHFYYCYYYY